MRKLLYLLVTLCLFLLSNFCVGLSQQEDFEDFEELSLEDLLEI
jgi:hypothetical protein